MLKIVQKDNKVLRQVAKEISPEEISSAKIKNIIKNMREALFASENGVALAAPQIGELIRLFIVSIPEINKDGKKTRQDPPFVFINPKIKKISRKKNILEEGCLSIEKTFGKTKRAEKLTIEAYDENGKKFIRGASGLLAQIIQHETDHLNGILFIDHAIGYEKQ